MLMFSCELRDHRKAVEVIRKSFPGLANEGYHPSLRDLSRSCHGNRADRPDESRINRCLRIAFRQTILVEEGYRIPNLEFASSLQVRGDGVSESCR